MPKNLHPDDKALWALVKKIARRHAVLHGLELKKVKPMHRRYAKKFYGYCTDRGVVAIGLRSERKKRYCAYRILETLAHELAHLRHWDHSQKWFALYGKILDSIGRDGIFYQRLDRLCRQK